MKGIKKILSLLLAFVLVLSLVACGNNDSEKETQGDATVEETQGDATMEETEGEAGSEKAFEGKTLKVAGLESGYGVEGWKKVIADFESLTGATVESTFAKNIEEEVRPLIQAGDSPDVMYISLGREQGLTETMLKEKAVLDVTDVLSMKVPGEEVTVSDKLLDGFTETYITNPYGDGKTYLMPLFYSPTGLFYNKALFKNGGGDLELPTTVDEMIGLKGKVEGASVLTYPTAGYFDQVVYALINEVGGPELFDKLMNYDSEAWANEATPVFEAVGKMLEELHPNTVAQANNEGFTQNQLSVMKNEALFMPNGTWITGEMAEAQGVAEGFDWGFMAIPAVKDGGDRYAYTFIEQVWVSGNTQEPELAKAFLAYLYSDAAVQSFVDNGGAVQPTKNASNLITKEDQKEFYSIYDGDVKPAYGNFASAPAVPGVNLSEVLFESINSVANGDKTVEQWQNEVVDAVKKIEEAIKVQ